MEVSPCLRAVGNPARGSASNMAPLVLMVAVLLWSPWSPTSGQGHVGDQRLPRSEDLPKEEGAQAAAVEEPQTWALNMVLEVPTTGTSSAGTSATSSASRSTTSIRVNMMETTITTRSVEVVATRRNQEVSRISQVQSEYRNTCRSRSQCVSQNGPLHSSPMNIGCEAQNRVNHNSQNLDPAVQLQRTMEFVFPDISPHELPEFHTTPEHQSSVDVRAPEDDGDVNLLRYSMLERDDQIQRITSSLQEAHSPNGFNRADDFHSTTLQDGLYGDIPPIESHINDNSTSFNQFPFTPDQNPPLPDLSNAIGALIAALNICDK